MRYLLFIAGLFFFAVVPALAGTSSNESACQQFLPPGAELVSAVKADLVGDGSRELILFAHPSHGFQYIPLWTSQVTILRRARKTWVRVWQEKAEGGPFRETRVVDVTGDSRPEVVFMRHLSSDGADVRVLGWDKKQRRYRYYLSIDNPYVSLEVVRPSQAVHPSLALFVREAYGGFPETYQWDGHRFVAHVDKMTGFWSELAHESQATLHSLHIDTASITTAAFRKTGGEDGELEKANAATNLIRALNYAGHHQTALRLLRRLQPDNEQKDNRDVEAEIDVMSGNISDAMKLYQDKGAGIGGYYGKYDEKVGKTLVLPVLPQSLAYGYLGDCLANYGQWSNAKIAYQHAILLDKRNNPASEGLKNIEKEQSNHD